MAIGIRHTLFVLVLTLGELSSPSGASIASGGETWEPVRLMPYIASSLIVDPVRDRMVVFGGFNTGRLDAVWALSLTSTPAWTPLIPVRSYPSARSFPTAVCDPVRDRMVVFGGYGLNDVWALSLAGDWTWAQVTPAGTPPGTGVLPTAIYDPVRERLVVFGAFSGGPVEEVWALSLTGNPTWTQLTPSGTQPVARARPTAIYDPVRDRVVLFGGAGDGYLNDLWALSLAGNPAWTQLAPLGTLPSARAGHTAIYDPGRDRMVVFGGISWGFLMYSDAWALSLANSPSWTQLTHTGGAPSERAYSAAIYDPVRDRMVVFGGGFGGAGHPDDLWALSLAGSLAWTQLTPAGTPPSTREGPAAIYDPLRGSMVVYGGGGLNSVWHLTWGTSPVGPGSESLSLAPAYPNPAGGDVTIGFELTRASEATLRVYDASGRAVSTIVEGVLPAGPKSIRWDRHMASGALAQPGLYFYELRANGHRSARKLVLIR